MDEPITNEDIMRYLIRLEEVAEARHQIVLGALATLLGRSEPGETRKLLQALKELEQTTRETYIGKGITVLPLPAQASPPIRFATDVKTPTS